MVSWRSSSAWGVQPTPFIYAAHILGIVSVVLVFVWNIQFRGGINFNSSNRSLIFNVHPPLMLLGFLFLGSEAVMAFKSIPASKQTRKSVHLFLHFCALALGIVGIIAVFKHHNLSGIDNLYSLHSWLGLVTTILYGIQWVIGFITFFFPGLAQSSRAAVLPWHVFFGVFVYGLAVATSELGFLEKLTFLQQEGIIGRFSTEAMLVNALGLIVMLLGICVVIAAILPVDQAAPDDYSPIE